MSEIKAKKKIVQLIEIYSRVLSILQKKENNDTRINDLEQFIEELKGIHKELED
jgi:hypothetical protein